ncbi:hypothetical protein DFA_08961 [Cavenderia fasciculata]|uniref:Uncharacterized protein n=1 Tax=Cavenderia fasciculata TaxID=261658 RepID=F4Q6B4_CACFS|nr:hypothetical protein DFA_08961 [Cavenderia fasciculata]EGG16424.1 hypothetical protein DFA_08961 [Cavenderia fasciculata]|eukprot:XP_004354824.1 hypothetical protein DFA_08961 [Cavenderia fasciculata]
MVKARRGADPQRDIIQAST